MNEIDVLREVLTTHRTIAVVGISAEPDRPSFTTARYMQQHGYRIIPVNPKYAEVLGERCYASLTDITEPVGIVNVFRRTEEVLPIAQQAIAIGAEVLWQQLGVLNQEASDLAQASGLVSIMDRCVKIEHARLSGGLGIAL